MGRLRERRSRQHRSIGVDSKGTDWKTVGYWATLRAAAPLPTDDGEQLPRISHPAPFGIKYWEIGNELYGNGYYYGSCGWEADMHVPYPVNGDHLHGSQEQPGAVAGGLRHGREGVRGRR